MKKIQIFQLTEVTLREKVSKYGVFSGLYFPAFGLNTYSVRIQENTDQQKPRIRTLFTQCNCRKRKVLGISKSDNNSNYLKLSKMKEVSFC